jgi:hypothetical protein
MPAFALPLLGGLLLGAAALLLLALRGRIAGISGIVGGLVARSDDRAWRLAFVLGLWTGGLVLLRVLPSAIPHTLPAGRTALLVGGLLVGLGAGLGDGCTSGHGVCGLGRRSPRSLVAVLVFMTVAVVTANLALRGVP